MNTNLCVTCNLQLVNGWPPKLTYIDHLGASRTEDVYTRKKGRGKLDKENKKGKACWLSNEWSEVYGFTTRLCGK